MATPGKSVFDRDMIFNLKSVVEWRVVTAAKQLQVDISNVWENDRQVVHDYTIDDQVYVEMTWIYQKLDYKKKDHIGSHKSLQVAQFESNGTSKRMYKYKTVNASLI